MFLLAYFKHPFGKILSRNPLQISDLADSDFSDGDDNDDNDDDDNDDDGNEIVSFFCIDLFLALLFCICLMLSAVALQGSFSIESATTGGITPMSTTWGMTPTSTMGMTPMSLNRAQAISTQNLVQGKASFGQFFSEHRVLFHPEVNLL